MSAGKEAGVKIAKGALFVILQVVAVLVIIGLVALGYYTAEGTMNVYMTTKDAFAKRAQVILLPSGDGTEDMDMLRKLFTNQALARDEILHGDYYEDFEITNYYERADVKFHIVWPWSDKTTIEVTEIVRDISGKAIEQEAEALDEFANATEMEDEAAAEETMDGLEVESDLGEEQDEQAQDDTAAATPTPTPTATPEPTEAPEPMEWQNGVYEVNLVKDKKTGVWKINSIELKDLMDVEELVPVPSVEPVEGQTEEPAVSASPQATTVPG